MGVRQLCGIDPEWVMFGPGDRPVHNLGNPDLDVLNRMRREVSVMARKAGIELTSEALDNLAQLIARESPEARKSAKAKVAATLRAIASGT